MLDTDDLKSTYADLTATQNRDIQTPVSGIRSTYGQMVFSQKCPLYADEDNDRYLKAYDVCAIELGPIEFALVGNDPIEMYINHPYKIYSFIETCELAGQLRCWTDPLEPGLDYIFYPNDKYSVRLIFENDSEGDLIFQVEYSGLIVDQLGAWAGLSTIGIASAIALATLISF